MSNPSEAIRQILEAAEQAKNDPNRFAEYENDPEGFVYDILGVREPGLWDKQVELLNRTLTATRIACRSGHGVGKSFTLACLILWWLYARRGLVVSTAPTKHHLEDVLWREVHNLKKNSLVHLPCNKDNALDIVIDHTWYATGVTTDQPGAFMGRHHPRLLLLGDEASELSEQTLLEMETCATGQGNVIVLIGNPLHTSGTFYEAFRRPDVWSTMSISCYDHPNVTSGVEGIKGAVTKEWVENKKSLWGEMHPMWYSRVLGQFPAISTKGVVPLAWVERARNNEKLKEASEKAAKERLPKIIGLDVARYGDNRCVLIVRSGDAVERIEHWSHTTLTETTGKALKIYREEKAAVLVVDAAGLGAGVYDMLNEEANINVVGFNGGHRAFNAGTFSNRRSELWWHLRQRLEKERLWLSQDNTYAMDVLVGDLTAPEYSISPAGRLQVETKEKMLERGINSPDFADALCYCFAADEDPEAEIAEPLTPQQDPDVGYQREEVEGEHSEFSSLPYSF